jgi:predicted O-methyltransferase YrrM
MSDAALQSALSSAAPAIPANRYTLPRRSLRFFPQLRREEDHPRSWVFPPYLDNPGVPWLMTLKDLYTSPATFPASLSPDAGLMLFGLVRNLRPRTLVEVGTFLGVSTLWMAAALEAAETDPPMVPGNRPGPTPTDGEMSATDSPSAVIHCFDDFGPMPPGPWRETWIDQQRDELVRESLKRAGLPGRAILHKGDSSSNIIAARADLAGRGGVDFALIDGDHSEEGAIRDLHAIEPVLNTGGYIVLHDTFPEQCGNHEGPRVIIDRIHRLAAGVYECCELYTAPLNYGMALLRRIG